MNPPLSSLLYTQILSLSKPHPLLGCRLTLKHNISYSNPYMKILRITPQVYDTIVHMFTFVSGPEFVFNRSVELSFNSF